MKGKLMSELPQLSEEEFSSRCSLNETPEAWKSSLNAKLINVFRDRSPTRRQRDATSGEEEECHKLGIK